MFWRRLPTTVLQKTGVPENFNKSSWMIDLFTNYLNSRTQLWKDAQKSYSDFKKLLLSIS